MTDRISKEKRSKNMSAIKCKDTKPEQYIRHELFARGYRYRKNVNYVEGHPDLFLRKYNTAIFVHGCFWHRHRNCKYAYMPKSRVEYWQNKFENNIRRDTQVVENLKREGIKVLIIWECTVKKMMKEEAFHSQILDNVESFLRSSKLFVEY